MSGQSPQIRQIVTDHLRPGEELLWFEGEGALPNNVRTIYWLAISGIMLWIVFAISMALGPWEPDVPIIVKLSLSLFFLGWGLACLWLAQRHLSQHNTVIHAVTNQRVIVTSSARPRSVMQAKLSELADPFIEQSDSLGRDNLRLAHGGLVTLNPFFGVHARWLNISNPERVKSLIEKFRQSALQESPS